MRSTPGNRRCSSNLRASCLALPPSSPLSFVSAPRLLPSRVSSSQLFYAITPQYYVLQCVETMCVCRHTHIYAHIYRDRKGLARAGLNRLALSS